MSLVTPRKGYKSVPWLFGKEIEIPEEWENVNVEYVADKLLSGGTPSTVIAEYWEGSIPWTKGAVLTTNNTTKGEKFISELGLKNSSTSIISKDNLLVVSRVSIGNISINKIDIAINQDITAVILNKTICLTDFLYWNLLQTISILVSFSQGTTIQGFTRKDLSSHKVLLPSLPEQQKIATILSNVDSLIELTGKVIENSKSLKKGLMQKLLTRGIGHTKFKKVPWLFGKEIEIPEEWEMKNIKDIFKLKSGSTPTRTNPELFTGNIPWVTSTDLNRSTIISTIEKITEEAITSAQLTIFSKGTFFIATYGLEASKTRGKCGIIEMDSACNQACMAFLPSEKMITMFLFYFYLHFGEKIVFSIAQGTKQQNLYSYTVGSVRLLLPSLPEQQKIASILSNIDSKITSQIQYKEKLERLKKSLMQKLLTGQIRVKV